MSVESVLFDRLTDFPALQALVSTRVYPVVLKQKTTLPALSYSRVSAERASAMGVDTGNVRARFQVDVWASSYASARDVTEQVRLALERYRNIIGTVIEDIYFLNDVDLYEDETSIYHVALDFEVNYKE